MLRALIDNVPDFMYVKDARSCFVVANASVAKSMGVNSPAALLGKTDFDFHPKQLASQYYEEEQVVIRQKKTLFEHEEESVDVDGNRIVLLTTKREKPLRDEPAYAARQRAVQ